MAKEIRDLYQLELFPEAINDRNNAHETSPEGASCVNCDIVSEFLVKTLIQKIAIRERKQISYLRLCSWRRSIKESQLAALKILKHYRPPEFVDLAADQFVFGLKKIYGSQVISNVVPVPCGNSGHHDCFSRQLAVRIAQKTAARVVFALEGDLGRGSSHPKKSNHWKAPRLTTKINGPALLVDDIATSGVHMTKSLDVLRKNGVDAVGVAWIGP